MTETSEESTSGNRKKKKGRGQDIQEETSISIDFAESLDVSCMGTALIRAPEIDNAYIVKYNK